MNKIDLILDKNGMLRFKNKLYVPNSTDLKSTILDELQKRSYFGHEGYRKMITTLRQLFYWPNTKSETTEYLSKCLDFQWVKDNINI